MTTYQKGLVITLLGVTALIPDSILLRLSEEVHFTTVIVYRCLLSGLTISCFLFLFSPRTMKSRLQDFSLEHYFMLPLMAIGHAAFVIAVHYTSVANTLLLLATSPIFAALISGIFLRERISLLTWITIGVVFTGVAVIGYQHLEERSVRFSWLGDLSSLTASLTLAIVWCLSRQVEGHVILDVVAIAAYIAGIAALFFVPTLWIESPTSLLAILAIGIFVTPVGYSLLNYGPKFLPAPEVGLLLLLETICAPLLAWFIFSEYPGDLTLVGGAIIVSAIGVFTLINLGLQYKR